MNRTGARRIAKELQLIRSRAMQSVRFHGLSMYPFLQEGDLVVVEPVDWGEIRRGDVVTYRLVDKYPTRRVVRKGAEHLELWCENWPANHFHALRDDVLGRAAARERSGRWLHRQDEEWQRAAREALRRYRRVWVRKLAGRVKHLPVLRWARRLKPPVPG